MDNCTRTGFIAHSMTRGYKRRIKIAMRNVVTALSVCENPYIAYSTGKDSTVMADLVWRVAPDIPAVYFDADACFPESRDLMKRLCKTGRQIVKYEVEPILDTMERVGGPTSGKSDAATMQSTVYKPIKSLLSEYGFDLSFVGLREEENHDREMAIRSRGYLFKNKRDGIYTCWPIGWLTFEDVWAYILSRDVDYSAVYDKLFELGLDWSDCRLSYCYGETKHTHGRWAILARGWPKLFNKFATRFPEVRRFI